MLNVIVFIVIIGVVLWVVNTYIPMAPPIKSILNVVVVVFLILWLLNAFGVMPQHFWIR